MKVMGKGISDEKNSMNHVTEKENSLFQEQQVDQFGQSSSFLW